MRVFWWISVVLSGLALIFSGFIVLVSRVDFLGRGSGTPQSDDALAAMQVMGATGLLALLCLTFGLIKLRRRA